MSKFIINDLQGKYEVVVVGPAATTLTSEKRLVRGIKARIAIARTEQQPNKADNWQTLLNNRDFVGLDKELGLFQYMRSIGEARWEK